MSKFTKQKSGYYRTTVQIGFDASGKPIKKYLSALTIKELETKVLETKQSISSGLMVGDNTLFGAYASRWIDIYKSTKGIQTVNMYRNALRKTEPLFGTAVNKITRSMIQDLINSQSNHPRTCEVLLLTLKQIFKSAAADGLIVRDPCISIALPRHIKKEKRALTDEERLKLRSAVLLPQERLLLLILYGTGCRPGEAYALTKADIDIRQGCIHINKSAIFDGNRRFLRRRR